ncbi:pyridoxal phosphate-dependent aminotransferase [bacterium]|nr:pyridoxal phosphate-dependent aminotransferase [bacterium]
MQLAQRVLVMKPSSTLAVTALVKKMTAEGHQVIGFGAGEPDFDTPQHIKDSVGEALAKGLTKYEPVSGTPAALKAIAQYMEPRLGRSLGPENVLISCGGKHSLYLAFMALVQPGDEVLIPAPYWVSYPEQARLAGAEVVEIPGSVDNDFKITPEQLEKAITPRSKVLIINSPSNPNGTMYSPAELKALSEVVLRHPQLLVFADDIYERLVYGSEPFVSFASLHPDLWERTVTFNCLSKSYAMTGWRVGFTVAEPKLIKAMSGLQGQMTSNITSFIYPAIVAALTGPQDEVEKMRQVFDQRGQLMHRLFSAIPGFKCCKPTGAFYVFPDISVTFGKTDPSGKKIETAADFAESLLKHAKVAVVPGEDFAGPNHIRASFATSNENIEKGLQKLAEFVGQLH